jgi:mannosyltransferase
MRLRPAALDPLIVGVLGAAVSLGGAGRPSFWYDEAATISASYSRTLDQLWQMLGNVDAVHGLYYLLMHGWFQIFPPTEFWSRAPSGLAVGGAAAGVVVLAK